MQKTGGVFSILAGLSYLAIGILVCVQPVLFQDANVDLFLSTLAVKLTCFVLYYLAIALSATFGIGAIAAVTNYFGVAENEVVKWAMKLAYVGFAILAMSYYRVFTVKPYMANFYTNAPQNAKDIILIMDPYISFAPNGLVTYGLVGIWLVLISVLAFKKKSSSAIYTILGTVLGVLFIAVTIQNVGALTTAILNTAKGIVSFIWFAIVGVKMVKTA